MESGYRVTKLDTVITRLIKLIMTHDLIDDSQILSSGIVTTSFNTTQEAEVKDNKRQSIQLEENENILLRNGLYLDGKRIDAVLTEKNISWYPVHFHTHFHEPKKFQQKIQIYHIITCTYEQKPGGHKHKKNEFELFPSCYFRIHYVKRTKHHKYKLHAYTLQTGNNEQCQQWVETLNKLIKEIERPKKLLVFINPVGGKKQAEKIFKEKAAPYFDFAQIEQTVIVTQRKDFAKDYLQTEDLSSFDGIVSVGGDGMFSEVMNGLLCHKNGEHFSLVNKHGKSIPIGIIPAGSTDTVSYCTTGTNDPTTAALHIVLGDELPLDVCSVWKKSQFVKYSVSLMGYGYFGDLLKESEKLRWMGPKRYDFAGFKKFVTLKSYECKISFLESSEKTDLKTQCNAGCLRCSKFDEDETDSSSTEHSSWRTIHGQYLSVMATNISCKCARSVTGLSPHAHTGDGCIDLILVGKTTRAKYLHHMIKTSQKTTDHFDFSFIDVFRVKEFKFLPVNDAESNENTTNELISPITSPHKHSEESINHSVWNVDGELVETPSIHVKVHRQLLRVFANGIENL